MKKVLSILAVIVVGILGVAICASSAQGKKTSTMKTLFNLSYTPPTVTITLNANGGTFSNEQVSNYAFNCNGVDIDLYGTTINNNKTIVMKLLNLNTYNIPTRTGYTFDYWEYNNQQVTNLSEIPFPSTNSLTLTAHWTGNQYAITYKDQGDVTFSGTHASGYPTEHIYGTATTLKTASKTGYTFGGWFTSSNCSGTDVTSLGATAYTAPITLYAKWTATYTISYTMNGGTHSGSYAGEYTPSSSSQTKSIGSASRTYYDGSVSANNGCTISGSTLTIPANTTGNITITWSWTAHVYTFTAEGQPLVFASISGGTLYTNSTCSTTASVKKRYTSTTFYYKAVNGIPTVTYVYQYGEVKYPSSTSVAGWDDRLYYYSSGGYMDHETINTYADALKVLKSTYYGILSTEYTEIHVSGSRYVNCYHSYTFSAASVDDDGNFVAWIGEYAFENSRIASIATKLVESYICVPN